MMAFSRKPCAPFYHFSVDDVFEALIEVSDCGMPLFEHRFFQFLRQLHEAFGTNVCLYLFYQQKSHAGTRTLKEVSAALREDFETNRWLRLGPHALDYETPPYTQEPQDQRDVFAAIYAEIERFAGKEGRGKWVRLHYFSESYELADFFRSQNVEALLLTDKAAMSYRLPASAKEQLRAEGAVDYAGIKWVRSHVRIENLVRDGLVPHRVPRAIGPLLARPGFAVVLTHECDLERQAVRMMTVSALRYFRRRGVRSL